MMKIPLTISLLASSRIGSLERCLDSLRPLLTKVPAELIVVFTGTDERVREIAARYTSHIICFPWRDDFSAARNEAFSHAAMDYCMWLDADDVLLEPDRAALQTLKETLDPAVSVVMAPYHTGFDESGRVTFSYYRERLIKNKAGMRWSGEIGRAHV